MYSYVFLNVLVRFPCTMYRHNLCTLEIEPHSIMVVIICTLITGGLIIRRLCYIKRVHAMLLVLAVRVLFPIKTFYRLDELFESVFVKSCAPSTMYRSISK